MVVRHARVTSLEMSFPSEWSSKRLLHTEQTCLGFRSGPSFRNGRALDPVGSLSPMFEDSAAATVADEIVESLL